MSIFRMEVEDCIHGEKLIDCSPSMYMYMVIVVLVCLYCNFSFSSKMVSLWF
jgi:hypothetical protein